MVMPVSRGFLLEAKLEGTWKGLYSFDQQPQVPGVAGIGAGDGTAAADLQAVIGKPSIIEAKRARIRDGLGGEEVARVLLGFRHGPRHDDVREDGQRRVAHAFVQVLRRVAVGGDHHAARALVDYLRSIDHGPELTARVWVCRLGRSSYTVAYEHTTASVEGRRSGVRESIDGVGLVRAPPGGDRPVAAAA